MDFTKEQVYQMFDAKLFKYNPIINNYTKTLKLFDIAEYTNSTREVKLTLIINSLKEKYGVKNYDKIKNKDENYDDYIKRIIKNKRIQTTILKYNKLRSDSRDKYLKEKKETKLEFTLEELRKKWIDTKKIDLDYYIVGLYLFIPPLRSDYSGSILNDNTINLKTVKVKTGIDKVELPQELQEFKHLHGELTKINNNYFCKKIERATTKIFGKRLTINVFRKLAVKNVKDNGNDFNERMDLAKNMRHSPNISMNIYETK